MSMNEESANSTFTEIMAWVSNFVDAYGFAVIVFALVAILARRQEKIKASKKISLLAEQIGNIEKNVKELEDENEELRQKISALKAKDLDYTMAEYRYSYNATDQQSQALKLESSFKLNSESITKLTVEISRIHLEAYYIGQDYQQLKEAKRFSSIAAMVSPEDKEAQALNAEVMMITAEARNSDSDIKTHERAWDEAMDVLARSYGDISDRSQYTSLFLSGTRLREEGSYELAGAALRLAHRIAERMFGHDALETITALANVAVNFTDRRLYAAAKPLFEDLIDRRRDAIGHIDENTYYLMVAATHCKQEISGPENVISEMKSLIKDGIDRFGSDNRFVLKAQNNLAACLAMMDRNEEAISLYLDTIEKEIRVLGSDHLNPILTRANLATQLFKVGRKDEAIFILDEVTKQLSRKYGPKHPFTLGKLNELERMHIKSSESHGYPKSQLVISESVRQRLIDLIFDGDEGKFGL